MDISETVEIEGDTYRTGFYGNDLWVENMEFTGTEYEVNGTRFRGLDCNGFACVHASIGGKTNGVFYCLDVQWEDAAAYYDNAENFTSSRNSHVFSGNHRNYPHRRIMVFFTLMRF